MHPHTLMGPYVFVDDHCVRGCVDEAEVPTGGEGAYWDQLVRVLG